MKQDWLFAPHYRYYVREMRILAYSQLLESYRSLTLGYMAEAFGVSTEFIDQYARLFMYINYFVNVDYFYAHFGLFLSQGSCRDSSPQDVYIARLTKSMRLWKPTGEDLNVCVD